MPELELPTVDLDQITAAWITALRQWNAEIKRLEELRDQAIEIVKDRMGVAVEARIDGVPVVSWATSRPATYIDKAALERDHPDIAARYTKEKKAARPFKLLELVTDGGDT